LYAHRVQAYRASGNEPGAESPATPPPHPRDPLRQRRRPDEREGRKVPAACLIRRCAKKATSENSPNSAGVVRRMANFDHCLCVSNPRCLRISWKVTSNCQRITNQQTIFCGSVSRSVHRRTRVLNSPLGSRTRTQRRGTANKPVLFPCVQSQRFLQYKISAVLRKGNAPFE
jgi:hypothetical protein